MARIKWLTTFAANFEVEKRWPLDARAIVEYKSDLTLLATWEAHDTNEYTYIGMSVVVANDWANNGIYTLEATDYTDINNWKFIGSSVSWIIPLENIVAIEPNLDEIAWRRYKTIASALVYIATQTPARDNRRGVKVWGTNSENFTVPEWVAIIGEAKTTILTGTINSWPFDTSSPTDRTSRLISWCIIEDLNLTASADISFFQCSIMNALTEAWCNVFAFENTFIYAWSYVGDVSAFNSQITAVGWAYNLVLTGKLTASFCRITSNSLGNLTLNDCDIKNSNLNNLDDIIFNAWNYEIYDSRYTKDFTIGAGITMNLYNTSSDWATTITVNGGTLSTHWIGSLVSVNVISWIRTNDWDRYDNRTSLLNADEFQGAVDEINSLWPILQSTDLTRHRISLVDDGAGNYNLDIWPAL